MEKIYCFRTNIYIFLSFLLQSLHKVLFRKLSMIIVFIHVKLWKFKSIIIQALFKICKIIINPLILIVAYYNKRVIKNLRKNKHSSKPFHRLLMQYLMSSKIIRQFIGKLSPLHTSLKSYNNSQVGTNLTTRPYNLLIWSWIF